MVFELEPETVNVKSRPTPESGTDVGDATVLLETVRLPVCGPPVVGANSTAALQLRLGPSVTPQVLFTSTNPAETTSVKLLRLALMPVLVTVIGVGVLTVPTPIVANTIEPGVTSIPAPAAPVPLSDTVAGVAIAVELNVRIPVVAPIAVGAKITPTAQLAPAARLPPQVLCATLNWLDPIWPDRPTVNPLAAIELVLVTVAVCAALVSPRPNVPKLNCVGVTVSPDAIWPVPFNGTVTGATPSVEEDTTSAAVMPPPAEGSKMT